MKTSVPLQCVVVAIAIVACHEAESPGSVVYKQEVGSARLSACDEGTCSIFGRSGECIRGQCVISGGCSDDTDCDDANPCTEERCEQGDCIDRNVTGRCNLPSGGEGSCEGGMCEREPYQCTSDQDCLPPSNTCAVSLCENNQCVRFAQNDGITCVSKRDERKGICESGLCRPSSSPGDEVAARSISSVRLTLPDDEIQLTEQALQKRIAEQLRYDVKVALIPIARGAGYNIVIHNRRDRTEVRGLCDPSLLAFNVAEYTARTNWKSQNLHVWLTPFSEGWAVTTRGSRISVEMGQASSPLGMYGVIDVRAFRIWLEKAFRPIVRGRSEGAPDTTTLKRTERTNSEPTRVSPKEGADSKSVPQATTMDNAKRSPAPRRLSGDQEVDLAWRLYGEGRREDARRALRRAKALGAASPELEPLLE